MVSWNDAAEMKLTRLQRRLGDAEQDRLAFGRAPGPAPAWRCISFISSQIDLFAGQQRGVAAVGDLDLLQHLANDHLDVLVVDLHALQTIDFLDFRHEVLGQRLDPQHFEDVVRIGRARDQVVALLDEIAFLHVDHLGLGDQVLDRIALFRDDGDLALRLVIADEFDAARDLGDDRVVLGLARLEQLGHARQTAGDVAGLGGFAAGTCQHVTRLDRLTILDRKRRARRQQIARRLARVLVQQGQARTQVFLLAAAARRGSR